MRTLRACALCLVLFSVVALPGAAHAYLLPADFLARLVADGRKPSLKDVALTLCIERAENAPKLEGRLLFKRPERMRQVLLSTPQRVEVVRSFERFVGDEASQTAAGPGRNLLPMLLFPAGKTAEEQGNNVLHSLAAVGIDANAVALARWQQGFAYVIGGEAWETQKGQLWLDKASFLPIRIVLPSAPGTAADAAQSAPPWGTTESGAPLPTQSPAAGADGAAVLPAPVHEWRLSHYTGGIPHVIEEWDCGVRLYRAEAVNMVVNQRLSDALFEPQRRGSPPGGRPPSRAPRRP